MAMSRTVDESVAAPGLSSGEVHERVLAAMAVEGEYQVVQVGPDRFQFARSYRPTWAIVLTILTVWAFLLGLLFLLVKTTETCLVVIESDHRGTRLRLQGKISPATLGRITASLNPGVGTSPAQAPEGQVGAPVLSTQASAGHVGAPVPSTHAGAGSSDPTNAGPPPAVSGALINGVPGSDPVAAVPSPQAAVPPQSMAAPQAQSPADLHPQTSAAPSQPIESPVEDHTIVVSRAPATAQAAADSSPSAVLDDGMVIQIHGTTLLGRDPAPADGEQAQLVSIADPSRSVSKTHLALIAMDSGVSIVDRHSTNGVAVVAQSGRTVIQPGSAVPVTDGDEVRFGDRTLKIRISHGVER